MKTNSKDEWGSYYEATQSDTDLHPIFEQTAAGIEKTINKEHLTALDLGCGTGKIALMLAKRGWDVTAIDKHTAGLKILKQRAQTTKLNITIKQHDICHNFSSQQFELITAGKIFPFIDPRTHSLNKILETNIFPNIKPNGWIVADFFGSEHSWLKTKEHITMMTASDLSSLFSPFAKCDIYENISPKISKEGERVAKWHEIIVVAKR